MKDQSNLFKFIKGYQFIWNVCQYTSNLDFILNLDEIDNEIGD
jgi:hypothetical protein